MCFFVILETGPHSSSYRFETTLELVNYFYMNLIHKPYS